MRIELLYFDGCPNWRVADERLTEALRAAELGFLGPPTIRIDGTDPFATGTEQVGLSCRVFATPAGSPTTGQLIQVLS